MGEEQVVALTKSFARFSSGTKFIIQSEIGGTIAKCKTRYPIKLDADSKPDYVYADIPLKYLLPVRKREPKPAVQ